MSFYTFILAFHIVSIATWMLMLIYVPKLFLYHHNHTASHDILTLQASSLYKVGTAAMVLSIVFGLSMLYLNPYLLKSGGWLHLKLLLVALLVGYHFQCRKMISQLQKGNLLYTSTFLRIFRIFPEIVTSIIIILSITKLF